MEDLQVVLSTVNVDTCFYPECMLPVKQSVHWDQHNGFMHIIYINSILFYTVKGLHQIIYTSDTEETGKLYSQSDRDTSCAEIQLWWVACEEHKSTGASVQSVTKWVSDPLG